VQSPHDRFAMSQGIAYAAIYTLRDPGLTTGIPCLLSGQIIWLVGNTVVSQTGERAGGSVKVSAMRVS
jgi:hypothetical protein